MSRRPHGRSLAAIQYWVQRETGWQTGHRGRHANEITQLSIEWWAHFGWGTKDKKCAAALKKWLRRRYKPKPKGFIESVFLAVMLQVMINVIAAMISEWLLTDHEARQRIVLVPEDSQ